LRGVGLDPRRAVFEQHVQLFHPAGPTPARRLSNRRGNL